MSLDQDAKPEKAELKYVVLADTLRRMIVSGELPPGRRLPSVVDLRVKYSASQATVERAQAILEQENLIVRESARGVFVKDSSRRPLKGVLGFVAPPEMRMTSYCAVLFDGMQEAARRAGQEILLFNNGPESELLKKVDGLVLNDVTWVQAIALTAPGGGFAEMAVSLKKLVEGLPHVWVNALGAPGVLVDCDQAQSQYDATRHLLELGHRKIAIFTSVTLPLQARYTGYLKALGEAGIEARDDWKVEAALALTPAAMMQGGYDRMSDWLQHKWPASGCTAVMASSDYVALGVVSALHERGLRVPEDMSVTGFDGIEFSEFVSPSLTTVKVPLQKIGETAVNLLIQQIKEPQAAQANVIFPTALRLGKSTAAPSGQSQASNIEPASRIAVT